ncbi:MAG TPA: hypothetical protein VL742_01825 [Casimicrobiaceae bacterium]|nr:hypothetical protein [Casimicrobiaceae bacterium]
MRRCACLLAILTGAWIVSPGVLALDKVDPYICPTHTRDSGLDCFLEAVPQTYTMCRQIKSIEVIEFGLAGAQEGVNGAKTESCIDKHKILIVRPYQAALRESASKKEMVQGLRKLYDEWLESLAKLVPAAGETDTSYKARVVQPYAQFDEQIRAIRAAAVTHPAKPKPTKTAKAAKTANTTKAGKAK